jgi:hypothetical protein
MRPEPIAQRAVDRTMTPVIAPLTLCHRDYSDHGEGEGRVQGEYVQPLQPRESRSRWSSVDGRGRDHRLHNWIVLGNSTIGPGEPFNTEFALNILF